MKILAITLKGKEFIYNTSTAHRVNPQKAEAARNILNGCKYKLKDGEIWHIYDIDKYDNAYVYADLQQFTLSKTGTLKERKSAFYNF